MSLPISDPSQRPKKVMNRKVIIRLLNLCLFLLFISVLPEVKTEYAYGDVEDYEPTGEPRCGNCHNKEMKPAIDYNRDPECLQCHIAGFSERYLEIDRRYKEVAQLSPDQVSSGKKQDKASKSMGPDPPGMVKIPVGEFIMGTNDWWPKSGPEHRVFLDSFYMDIYEVTNAEYKKFVDATGHRAPDHWKNSTYPPEKKDHPVTFVDWYDANDYCHWAGKRLPTEAEWEKAARGTDGKVFPWGNVFDSEKGNTPQHGKGGTMPVGSFASGVSPYEVHDLAGNVWEWTSDWYKAYSDNKHPDENVGEKYRVIKGGSWYDCTYYRCGISAPTYNRVFMLQETRNNNFGFRCAKSP